MARRGSVRDNQKLKPRLRVRSPSGLLQHARFRLDDPIPLVLRREAQPSGSLHRRGVVNEHLGLTGDPGLAAFVLDARAWRSAVGATRGGAPDCVRLRVGATARRERTGSNPQPPGPTSTC
jgi:hypothetical protein